MVGAGLVSSRLKGWRRVQGWKIGWWGGSTGEDVTCSDFAKEKTFS
jgi:hypothetical protein